YTRNMATGASGCQAAIILVDAVNGVLAQTRRHALICALMGIQHVLFAVNKMDRVDWSRTEYERLEHDCEIIIRDCREHFGVEPGWAAVPVSAMLGDCLARLSSRMPWFSGKTVLEWLEAVPHQAALPDAPFRFPVQYIIRPGSTDANWQSGMSPKAGSAMANFRAYAGRIVSGRVCVGDAVVVLPSEKKSRVTGILEGRDEVTYADAGRSVALVLEDQIDIVRGDGIVLQEHRPEMSDQFKAWIVWMQDEPLVPGRRYVFKSLYGSTLADVNLLKDRIDMGSYLRLAADSLAINEIGEVHLELARPMPYDRYRENRQTGGFILIDRKTNATAGCGMILHGLRRSTNVHWQHLSVDRTARQHLLRQQGRVIWLTGLSGSGKSTIADALEKRLHAEGRLTMVLDGDNVRHGLCRDLGFTEEDRVENIRRVGEVAKLMLDAGLIVITSFISPYRADREMVRSLFPEGDFVEVFVDAPLAVCEQRDPKGLYRKARSGEIPNFTGINAPYEAPENPEMHVRTAECGLHEIVETLAGLLKQKS
nr:adenylyl-sulfate kinase [Spirochaetota bacterium]